MRAATLRGGIAEGEGEIDRPGAGAGAEQPGDRADRAGQGEGGGVDFRAGLRCSGASSEAAVPLKRGREMMVGAPALFLRVSWPLLISTSCRATLYFCAGADAGAGAGVAVGGAPGEGAEFVAVAVVAGVGPKTQSGVPAALRSSTMVGIDQMQMQNVEAMREQRQQRQLCLDAIQRDEIGVGEARRVGEAEAGAPR